MLCTLEADKYKIGVDADIMQDKKNQVLLGIMGAGIAGVVALGARAYQLCCKYEILSLINRTRENENKDKEA